MSVVAEFCVSPLTRSTRRCLHPPKGIRGMRNRIAHDYGAVDFKIVWAVTQKEIEPLMTALETYFKRRPIGKAQACRHDFR
jgi:hypothetical protein